MYSRGMYVGPPGGVNISRCIAASTSRAIFTRNSSQTRLGLACSSAASSKSSPVSPSIHFLSDSINHKFESPQCCVLYALAFRDPNYQAAFDHSGLGWLRHDNLKHIGHLLKSHKTFIDPPSV